MSVAALSPLPFGYIVEDQSPKYEWMPMAIAPSMKKFFRFSHLWDQYHFVSLSYPNDSVLNACFFSNKKNGEIIHFENSSSFCFSADHGSTFFRLSPGVNSNFIVGSVASEVNPPLLPPAFDDSPSPVISPKTEPKQEEPKQQAPEVPQEERKQEEPKQEAPEEPQEERKQEERKQEAPEVHQERAVGSLAQILAKCTDREAVTRALKAHLQKQPRDLIDSHIKTVERLFKVNKSYHSVLLDCLLWIEQQYGSFLTESQIQSIHETRARITHEVEEAVKEVKLTFTNQLKNIALSWEKFSGSPDRAKKLLSQAQDSVVHLELLIGQKKDEIASWAPSPTLSTIKDHIEQFLTRIQTEMLDPIEDSSLIPHRKFLNQKIGMISKNFSLLVSPPSSSSSSSSSS